MQHKDRLILSRSQTLAKISNYLDRKNPQIAHQLRLQVRDLTKQLANSSALYPEESKETKILQSGINDLIAQYSSETQRMVGNTQRHIQPTMSEYFQLIKAIWNELHQSETSQQKVGGNESLLESYFILANLIENYITLEPNNYPKNLDKIKYYCKQRAANIGSQISTKSEFHPPGSDIQLGQGGSVFISQKVQQGSDIVLGKGKSSVIQDESKIFLGTSQSQEHYPQQLFQKQNQVSTNKASEGKKKIQIILSEEEVSDKVKVSISDLGAPCSNVQGQKEVSEQSLLLKPQESRQVGK